MENDNYAIRILYGSDYNDIGYQAQIVDDYDVGNLFIGDITSILLQFGGPLGTDDTFLDADEFGIFLMYADETTIYV